MDATRLSDVSFASVADPPLAAPPHCKALLFEWSDVLYESSVWRRWLSRLLARMGLSTNYQAFFDHWDSKYMHDVHVGRRSLREALAAMLLQNGLTPALVEEIVSAAGPQYKAFEAEPRLLPGVAATLSHLTRRGLALAISADTDQTAEALRAKLKRLGVAGQFRHVISSRDLGHAKPAPVCYLAAVTALGLMPQAVVFVGCRPAHLAGAAAAGLETASIGHETTAMGAAEADYRVSRFDHLLDFFG